jgi:hypothetical protein
MDVEGIKAALAFSSTFYVQNKEIKYHLRHEIRSHQVWRDFKVWERAIYQSIQDEIDTAKA